MINKVKRNDVIKLLCLLGGVVFLIGVWAIASAILESQGNHLFPGPWQTFLSSLNFLFGEKAGVTWASMGWTFARILIGFSISFIVAAILGIIAGFFPYFRSFLKPFVGICRAVPTAAIVIILASLFTKPDLFGQRSYIPCVLVFLVCFPLIYEAFASGIENEDGEIKKALAIECGSKSLKSLKVYIPDVMPYVILASTQSLGLAVKVSVMSELLIYSSQGTSSSMGIGIMIVFERMQGSIENVVTLSVIALAMVLVLSIPLWISKKKLKAKLK